MKKNVNDILTTKRQKYMTVLTVLLLLISVGLFSYALTYNINYVGLNTNKISNCSIDISFKDNNPVRLTSSYPMDYATAKEYDPYTFYIKSNSNNCDSLSYRISMKSICSTCTTDSCSLGDGQTCNCTTGYQIDESLINYELKNVTTGEIITGEGINGLNKKFTLNGVETDTYEMRIWISEKATNSDLYVHGNSSTPKNYCGKLNVEVVASGNLDISGANAPELATGMIPVYYDETNEVWKKADSNNKDANNKWYDYDNKMWANVVTVTETNRETYLNAKVGTEISMDDINTMWVWIPRFSATGDYDTFNGTNNIDSPGAFNITFVDNNESAHDAFTFGTQNLNGFWVGKFENSSNISCNSQYGSDLESDCNLTTIRPKIIPNQMSWYGAQVSTFFYDIKNMTESGNQYGFGNNVDTHMLKNNEWGAVAYLTQSMYGRCTTSTNCTKIGINNNSSVITGYGAPAGSNSSVTNGAYETSLGQNASTTENIYGVYDMSGGLYEYVMGVYWDGTNLWSGTDSSINCGFNGLLSDGTQYTSGVDYPNRKYYNLYTTSDEYINAGYQHALEETAGWYSSEWIFVSEYSYWFSRGGSFQEEDIAGIFYYNGNNEGESDFISSRTSIIIK
ncbi:MAG: hypothetical protein PUC23_01500 [bacterium]|nr:hypothetical protein [bacterium]